MEKIVSEAIAMLAWEMKKAAETVNGIKILEIKAEGYNRVSEL